MQSTRSSKRCIKDLERNGSTLPADGNSLEADNIRSVFLLIGLFTNRSFGLLKFGLLLSIRQVDYNLPSDAIFTRIQNINIKEAI